MTPTPRGIFLGSYSDSKDQRRLSPDEVAGWLHGKTPRAGGGWSVTIDETQAAGAVTLARRLTAQRGDVVVKLVVDDYRPLAD